MNNQLLHGINSVGTVSGERILRLDSCANAVFGQSAATGYTSTIGAIVELNSCNAVSIQDVDVTNNTKSIAAPSGSFAARSMFVSANTCTGVDLVHVKVNNNTINNTNSVINRFSAIGFTFSHSCSLHRCETSNNTDIADNTGAANGTLDRGLFIGRSNNFIVTEHQANNNRSTEPIAAFRGIAPNTKQRKNYGKEINDLNDGKRMQHELCSADCYHG